MNQPFLSAYQKLSQNASQSPFLATGLWLLHGDEPLLSQWLIEKMQPAWRAAAMPMQRMDIVSAKSWQDILGELNSLSLFDDSKVVIAQGNYKPDKASLAELEAFASQNRASQNPTNCLIVLMPKQDKKSQTTAFFKLCEKLGNIIDCQLYQENQRKQVLEQRAKEFGLQLTGDAWQQLLMHTQHNLLTAFQTLWRLSFLYPANSQTPAIITEAELQDGLVSQSHFSTFDLSDAMLSGNLAQVMQILQHLRQADEPESLILWVIAKDIRTLQGLLSGQNFQELGIWQSKQGMYSQALQRLRKLSPQQQTAKMQGWTDKLYQCDQAIKGLIKQPAWELITQLASDVAGVKLFY